MSKYKIAIYTIALNEESHVKRWFESAKDADLLVIADTGSIDKTRVMAKSLGIAVTEIEVNPWRFDVARNASLALIPEEFDICIQLDMDEVLPQGWRKKVEEAYDNGNYWPIYKHVTLRDREGKPRNYQHYFKIHPRRGFSWKYPIHEILIHDTKLNFERKLIDLEVDHIKDETKSRKSYLGLLEQAVQEEPDDWRMNHYLNREYFYNQDWIRVLQSAYKCETISGGWDVERASTYMWASEAAHHLRLPPLSEEWAKKATEAAANFYESWHWRAHIAHLNNNWADCLKFAKNILTLERQNHHLVKPDVWEWWGYDLVALSSHRLGFDLQAIHYGQLAYEANPTIERLKKNLFFYRQSYIERRTNSFLVTGQLSGELVSLITPTRNREKYLKDQYQNLLSQNHTNWEWLILDDSDEMSQFAKECKDERVRYFHLEGKVTQTIGEKRNNLIEKARGNWIAHIDDDDFYGPEYLSTLLEEAMLKSVDLIYLNSWYFIDENLKIRHYSSSNVMPRIEGWGFSYFYRKSIGTEQKFPNHNWEDHYWFQEVIKKFKYFGYDDTTGLVLKRVHTQNTSNFPWSLARQINDSELKIILKACGDEVLTNSLTSSGKA